ncbi:hypothetical protein AB5J62_12595 [Amycolatopsis sp. cg5]|uniref:hypothetical protein n=1 Tax=Amycolatopsis sp. cg5 TaxID=3238802 RepID=UPI003525860F
MTGFLETLARRRGRRIELVPMKANSAAPCGVLAATDQADYVFYTTETSALHQEHILLHEIGHLLCGHAGSDQLDAAVPAALMPNLSPELIRRVLGRTTYAEEQEREAELVASLIMRQVRRETPTAHAGGLGALEAAFGGRNGRAGRRR